MNGGVYDFLYFFNVYYNVSYFFPQVCIHVHLTSRLYRKTKERQTSNVHIGIIIINKKKTMGNMVRVSVSLSLRS